MEMNDSDDEKIHDDSINQQVVRKMQKLKEGIYQKAEKNIKASQKRMKKDYDKKHSMMRVCMGGKLS